MVTIKGNVINLSRLLIAATAGALAVIVLAVPANASTAPTTPITLTISGGALQISAPTSNVTLGGTANASGTTTVSSSLGLITVTDARSASPAFWTASVSSSDFTAPAVGSGPVPAPIPASAIAYTVYYGTTTGVATADLLTQTQGAAESLYTGSASAPASTYTADMSNSGQAFVSAAAGVGDNTVTWNPKIVITIPSTTVAGTNYGAIVTHSVL